MRVIELAKVKCVLRGEVAPMVQYKVFGADANLCSRSARPCRSLRLKAALQLIAHTEVTTPHRFLRQWPFEIPRLSQTSPNPGIQLTIAAAADYQEWFGRAGFRQIDPESGYHWLFKPPLQAASNPDLNVQMDRLEDLLGNLLQVQEGDPA